MDFIDEDLQKLYNRAYFFLKFRPRSRKEILDYLNKKIQSTHWSQTEVKKVVKGLEEQGFVDDEKFIEWFVAQRNILKPKSAFVIKRELTTFGIDKLLIEKYFDEHPHNEQELALKTLRRKWFRLSKLSKEERFKKASGFLLRRGFGYETVKRVIDLFEGR